MLKQILKMLIPSEKKLAKMAAEKIADSINSQPEEREKLISTWAGYISNATNQTKFVLDTLEDGKVDELEVEKITEKLCPLFARILELI